MHPISTLQHIVSFLLHRTVSAAGLLPGVSTGQAPAMYPSSTLNPLKVPGESPAYYCAHADPSNDIFQIRRFDLHLPMYGCRFRAHRSLPNGSFAGTRLCVQWLFPHDSSHRQVHLQHWRLPMAEHHRKHLRAPRAGAFVELVTVT